MSCYKVLVGSLTLTAPETVEQAFECAAWQRTVIVPPGTYEVYAYVVPRCGEEPPRVHQLAAICVGKVISASFQSRLGASLGRDDGPKEIGTEHVAHIHLPTYWRVAEMPRLQPDLTTSAVEVTEWDPEWDPHHAGRMGRYVMPLATKFRITTPERERISGMTLDAEFAS